MKQIKFYGLGGQGVVTAAKIFAKAAALGEGRNALSIPVYGHERRGAPVFSDLIISDSPIKMRSFVYEPDVVIVFDLAVMEKGVDVSRGAKAGTIFIINHQNPPAGLPFGGHRVFHVDARQISLEELGRDIPNTAMLGAAAGAGLCGLQAVSESIRDSFGKGGQANVTSAARGYHELKEAEFLAMGHGPAQSGQPGRALPETGGKSYLGPCSLLFAAAKTGSWRLNRPCPSAELCVLCGVCAKYCPVNAIAVRGRKQENPGLDIDLDFCKGCGICANICPRQAMEMISEREVQHV